MAQADDATIWNLAVEYGFVIVSKDSDFHQRSLIFGAPPKFLYLRVGNCPTKQIVHLLRENHLKITAFISDLSYSVYILT
jgi:predicted nuclease of predicted toxin-antitoxin system